MDTAGKRGLEVYLLGPMRVVVDGRELDVATWKSKRAVTLFKYLVARCGERVPRDVLTELLWPESEDGEKSAHNLHTVTYYLRRTLEPGLKRYQEPRFLRQAHGLYWIEPSAPVWTDVEEFQSLIRRADALRGADRVQALALYRRALALYRDDFCAEDLYEDWAVTVRERFRELYFSAALQAANVIMEVENDVSGAVNVCRTALAREPYREELHQAVIGFLIRAGRYGEAARQYRTCERLFYEEFGLSPSPETQALFESMKAARTATGADGRPNGASSVNGTDRARRAVERANVEARADAVAKTNGDAGGNGVTGGDALEPDGLSAEAAGVVREEVGPVFPDRIEDDPGRPFVCDWKTYGAIFRLEMRRMARTGESIGLLRVQLGGEASDSGERGRLERVLARVIRQGDVVCWESPRRFVVHLCGTTEENVEAVGRRLLRALGESGFAVASMEDGVVRPGPRRMPLEAT